MNLLKSSFLNGFAVAIKTATLLAVNKILAVYVGPSGYAVIGQLQNIISSVLMFSTGGISSGIVKYTAQYNEDDDSRLKVWKTATGLSIILTIMTSSSLLLFSGYISKTFLLNESYESILNYLAIFLILFVFNSIGISIINGKRKIKDYVLINILSSLFSLVYTAVLVYFYGLYGALFALISNQAVVCFLTFFVGIKKGYFDFESLFGRVELEALKKLSKFSTMILIPSVLRPICYTFVRQMLTSDLGQIFAGSWDAMWKLSNVYLSFITTVLGIYFLPKFSELKTKKLVQDEIIKGYRLIIPTAAVLCLLVYLNRISIVNILFTDEFALMLTLFKWQILGDFVKIIAWVISYAILAKAMVKTFLALELIFILLFAIFCKLFVGLMGFEGVAFAHFLNYGLFLIITSLVFSRSSFGSEVSDSEVGSIGV